MPNRKGGARVQIGSGHETKPNHAGWFGSPAELANGHGQQTPAIAETRHLRRGDRTRWCRYVAGSFDRARGLWLCRRLGTALRRLVRFTAFEWFPAETECDDPAAGP